MRRRYISPLLVLGLLAACLTACSSGGGAGGTTTVTFWTHTHPPMIELNKKLISEYEAKNPNVKINYQQIPNADFNTKMLTALSNGSGPDVINMDDTSLRGDYITKNLVVPIDPAAVGKSSVDDIKAGYLPHVLDGASGPDGKLYGLPSEFNATAFAINKANFTAAGLDPDNPPKTWTDVLAADQKLKAAGKGGFSFLYLSSGWYTQQLQTLLNETGGAILKPDGNTSALADAKSVAALQLWDDLVHKDNLSDPNTSSRDATAPFADFESGKTSMTVMYPWAVAQIASDNPATYKNMAVVPLPQVDPAQPSGRWYGYYLAVNKASKHQKEAWRFIAYVTSQSQRWLTDVNFIQPVQGWDQSPAAAKVPFLPVWRQAYQQGKFDQIGPHWAEVMDAIKAAVEGTIFDHKPPAQTLQQAAKAVDGILSS
jgi:multiple sugar transport system substrate-binding protein